MDQSRRLLREIGTAFAVLAIYLLTILAPMHQARASQLDFAALGYETLETGWVLCNPLAESGQDRDLLVAKCPAAGIGKNDLVEPDLAVLPIDLRVATLTTPMAHDAPSDRLAVAAPPSGSRAPPFQV